MSTAKMPHTELTMRRLSKLYDKWLDLRDQFPMVCHCLARQDGPVTIYEESDDSVTERVSIGEIASDVFDPQIRRQAAGLLAGVTFENADRKWEFGESLYRSFWQMAALRSLDMQDRTFSLKYFDAAATRIEVQNEPGQWFGCCTFERAWENSVPSFWFEKVTPLSTESLRLCTEFSSDSHDYSRLLERWLSYVYQQLNVKASASDAVGTSCIDLKGATIKSGLSTRTISDRRWNVSGEVLATRMWLPLDMCTASAMAIEQIISGQQEPRRVRTDGQPDPEQDRWMGFEDAARLTSINRGQFHRAADAGEILDNKETGRERKIDRASMTHWAEEYRKRQTG